MNDKFKKNSDKNLENDNDFKVVQKKRKTVRKTKNIDSDIYDNYGDDYNVYDYDSYEEPINSTLKSKSRAKSKRRRKKSTSVGISLRIPVLIIVLSFIIVAAAALMLPVFNVVEVYCEGNSSIKTEDIITTAQLSVGKNIFLENIGSAKRRIEDINSIKSVEIRRVFPNKICITIEERTPAGYISTSSGVALVSDDGIILSKYDGETSEKIKQSKTPAFVTGTSDTNNTSENQKSDNNSTKSSENKNQDGDNQSDKSKDENQTEKSENKSSDVNDSKDSGVSNNSSDGDNKDNKDNTQSDEFEKIPLINGITLSNDNEGEKAEAEDSEKLEKWFYLCSGLKGADLLNRATYINIENTEEITVVIENRLEVKLGKVDNIDYRCKFLAEVINTKLGAAETAVLDYTGNDIYAIDRDDGGARVKKTDKKKDSETDKEKSNSQKSDSDDSEDSEDNDSDSDIENADTDTDSDSTSTKSTSSKSLSASSSSKSSSKSSLSDEEDEDDEEDTVTSSSSMSSKSTSSTSSSSADDEDL